MRIRERHAFGALCKPCGAELGVKASVNRSWSLLGNLARLTHSFVQPIGRFSEHSRLRLSSPETHILHRAEAVLKIDKANWLIRF